MRTLLCLLSLNCFAGQLVCDPHSLRPVDFPPDATVQIFTSNDLLRWEQRWELAAAASVPLTPTNQVEFYSARVKPAPAHIRFDSLTVTGSVFVLSGSADKVLIDLQCEKLKGRLTQQHFGLSNKLSILTAADFTFPPQPVTIGTNLLHCSFLDIDQNRIQTNITVISLPGPNQSTSWNTNGSSSFISITAHSFSWSYTYFDSTNGSHSTEASGAMTQPDGVVTAHWARDHYYNNDICTATYSGNTPWLHLDAATGPCTLTPWRTYPASTEFGNYSDHFPFDAYAHSCSSAVNLYLPGSGTRRLHVIVQLSICRWIRNPHYGDELDNCVSESSLPLYIGGQPAFSNSINFDTTDGTQWDITPTLAPMNTGYFSFEVDYTVSEIPVS